MVNHSLDPRRFQRLIVTVAVIRILSIAINLIRVFTVVPGIHPPPLLPRDPSIALVRVFPVITGIAAKHLFFSSALDPVGVTHHEKSSSSCFVVIQHLFVLNVFVLYSMPSSCPMDEVHCLLVLNIFAFLGQVSFVQHPPLRQHLHWFGFCRLHFLEFPLQIILDLHRPCICVCNIHISWDNTPRPP